MKDIDCPFDGDFCEKKQQRVNEWRMRCLCNPQAYYTSCSHEDLFYGCPIENEEFRSSLCDRFRRFLFIVENVKKELAKQNGQK